MTLPKQSCITRHVGTMLSEAASEHERIARNIIRPVHLQVSFHPVILHR